MKWLTNLSIKNPAAVIIISLFVALGGIFSFFTINIESEPQAKLGMLTISTTYPNASSKDVLEDVTKPLEKEMDSISGIKSYTSSSQENFSMLTVSIEANADMDKVKDEVDKRVSGVKLPSGAGHPKVKLRIVGSEPMYFLSISNEGQSRSTVAFNHLVDDKFIEDLQSIDGVESVEAIGTEKKVIRIRPKMESLRFYKMSVTDLKKAIEAQHFSSSVGSVTVDGMDYITRIDNQYTNLQDIIDTRLPLPANGSAQQGFVQLGDLADVQWEFDHTSVSRLNGKPAVAIQISKTFEGNIVNVSDQIQQKMEQYQKEYPDLKFEIVSDRSDFVKSSIGGMAKEGAMGIVMAILVIFLFLRHLKLTLIVLVSIPLSILVSVMFLKLNDISINLMSLFGMTVAIGRVVDDSIVVIENIYRRNQTGIRDNQTIIQAVGEVAGAITSSTLATVAVFLPIAFVSGITGDFFKPFAVAVAWSLLASLIVAVTLVPLLASVTMRKEKVKKELPEGRLASLYPKILLRALENKGKVALITVIILSASVGLATRLPLGFLPDINSNLLFIKMNMPIGTSLDTTSKHVQQIENVIMKQPEVLYVQSKMGAPKDEAKQTNLADMTIKLKSGVDEDEVQKQIRSNVEPLIPADAQVTFSKPSAGGQGGYQAVLYGADFDTLKEAASLVEAKIKTNPLLTNVKDNVSDRRGQLSIHVDRDRAMQWGLTPDQVSRELAVAVGTSNLRSVELNGEEYDLVFGTDDAISMEKLADLSVTSPMGQQVPLKEIVSLRKEEVPTSLLRKEGKPYIQITADILGEDKGGISQKQTDALKQLKLPEGVTISSEGVQQDMQKGFIEMFAAMGAAVLLILLVMVASFGNFTSPLAVLLSLPLASIGGLLGLWLSGGVLDMTVLIGFLMLIGIVVTNAIVLIDRVQQRMNAGMNVREALLEAGKTRLRPIMMTAVATIAALLPLALGFSEDSLLSKGLSTVVIGGLISSTLMTLVVIPVGYESLYRLVNRKRIKEQSGNASQAM
ncbi:efflux RND transporter permease subunit [Brevibacillus ginsengisoli]|uniref:efflux RND transporter permease subunit n=1 Tax=Brevibacillus ginsengisoli TaxID=363854 RepID=UPI003CF77E9A